jgi:hypothetical protein
VSSQRRRLLRRFMKLIENSKLTEKDYSELLQKLAVQAEKGDGAVVGMMEELKRIHNTVESRSKRMKAIGIAIEEFIAKVIAEAIWRGSRGY